MSTTGMACFGTGQCQWDRLRYLSLFSGTNGSTASLDKLLRRLLLVGNCLLFLASRALTDNAIFEVV